MDLINQEDKQKDEIYAQCATCGRVKRKLSGWGKIREYNPKFAQIFCPNCWPKKEEK